VLKTAAAAAGRADERADERAYRLTGRREHWLTARQVMACFAPVRERLAAGIAAVGGAGSFDSVVLTGGLGWFPLASVAVSEITGVEATVTGPDETVRGALLLARREVSEQPPAGLEPASLPVNRISAGLLEEGRLRLPWNEPLAGPSEGVPPLDGEDLVLMISGRYRSVRLPGLRPGEYLIGVRAGWSGAGVLVVRAAAGDAVHVVALAAAAAR
jgi:hypothetical protein